jgi:hypothetical protein
VKSTPLMPIPRLRRTTRSNASGGNASGTRASGGLWLLWVLVQESRIMFGVT